MPICALCKGRGWCGKERCPITVKIYAQQKTAPLIDSLSIAGASPPGVFVGRYGYPKVSIGPLIPPQHGDTSVMDTPELWQGKSIDQIAEFRFSLVRGKTMANVKNVENAGRLVDATRELALADNPADIEANFTKKPSGKIILGDEVQPFGPSAPLKSMDVSSLKVNSRIEKATCDTDLKAGEAVLRLYRGGVLISRIQKAFSVGAFGLGRQRRFVPTRWSITAVDSTLGLAMMEKTRTHPKISEYRVYETESLDNRWIVLMLPREWCYELIEAWYPKTLWNPSGKIEIFGDHEFHDGRSTYAEIGGCYYAARLAVNELLNKERRQAGVCVWREAHPGYIMPVGVWNVREAVRAALRNEPRRFASLQEALQHVASRFDIQLGRWIRASAIIQDSLNQRRLTDFFRVKA